MKPKLIAACALLACAGAVLSGCSDVDPETKLPPTPRLKPEMTVRIAKHPQYACLSEDLLNQAVTHSVRGEDTKFRAMFSSMNCLVLPDDPATRFKLLAVRGGAVEFTNITNKNASMGLWTFKEAFVPAEN